MMSATKSLTEMSHPSVREALEATLDGGVFYQERPWLAVPDSDHPTLEPALAF